MGVATTTDTTDSVRTSSETLKNLYGMSVEFDGTTKKKYMILNSKINPKYYYLINNDILFFITSLLEDVNKICCIGWTGVKKCN